MKRLFILTVLSLTALIPFIIGMTSPNVMTDARVKSHSIIIEQKPNINIHEGYFSQQEETVLVRRGRKVVAKIHLFNPVMVEQAEKEEPWGFYQFPYIGIAEDKTLVISWQMSEDSHRAYGDKGLAKGPKVSMDGGVSWSYNCKSLNFYTRGYNVRMRNGNTLQISTPSSKSITEFSSFPKEYFKKGSYSFYFMDDLPDVLRGVYFTLKDKNNHLNGFHAILNDPTILRYSIDGYMPIVWWGNIEELDDNSLIAGVYPCYYPDVETVVSPGSVSFYKSIDKGHTWCLESNIPFIRDGIADVKGENEFSEPAFTILRDSSFVCVLRTGSTSPMYKVFSTDFGKTWTDPVPFTPNGVKPCLLHLNNDILVLSSGRPGVQLRFNIDGTGKEWTEPIEMIHFINEDGTYTKDVSCGYTSMIEVGDDTFFLVYSDFTTHNSEGEQRKSIWCRKVRITK